MNITERFRGHRADYPWLLYKALLRLHKPYFSQVLDDKPGDILKHKYAPSFIAVFRSAWRLIRGICLTFERVPEFLLRAGVYWSHAADAAVSSAPSVSSRSRFHNAIIESRW